MIGLPSILASGMVLQRDIAATLWGTASKNETLMLTFQECTYEIKPVNKLWEIKTEPLTVGGPFELTIKSDKETITLTDVYVGDVWLCSGQSNMELTFDRLRDTYPEELVKTSPYIRQFKVPSSYDFNEQHTDIPGAVWSYANPDTIIGYSGTAYFFGQHLSETYNVPIGLLNASLGGSTIECWLDENSVRKFPDAYALLKKYRDMKKSEKIREQNQNDIQQWYEEIGQKDIDLSHDFESSPLWNTIELPGFLSDRGIPHYYGALWLRKKINVPKEMTGIDLKLWLGRMVDKDIVFVNGQYVGDVGYEYPPRKYTVPSGLLHEGENIITVHLYCDHGGGAFIEGKRYELFSDTASIDLTGTWEYALTAPVKERPTELFLQRTPTGLFNCMIAPLAKFAIKGAIWYQGESNIDSSDTYSEAFKTLIRLWRKIWNQGDFPFIYAQLPNYQEPDEIPNKSKWAAIREAQRDALYLNNTGMAVTIDVGEWNDLHPLNKKAVGYRLANIARGLAYHEDIPYKTPVYSKFETYGNKIVISFDYLEGGLTTTDNKEPSGFTAAGKDGIYHQAHAMIDEDRLYVWCDSIIQIKTIRYAWADSPKDFNLCNKAGLLVSPFQATLV